MWVEPSVQGAIGVTRRRRPFDQLQLSAGARASEFSLPLLSGGVWDRVDVGVILALPYHVVQRGRDAAVSAQGVVEGGVHSVQPRRVWVCVGLQLTKSSLLGLG